MLLKQIMKESFTSGCIGSVPSIIGTPMKRQKVDYTKFSKATGSNHYIRLGNAMQEFIKIHGAMTGDDIENIKKVLK